MLGKKPLVWVFFIAAIGAVGCGGPSPRPSYVPAVETKSPASEVGSFDAGTEPAGVYHTVVPGQTLWTIARTYGVERHRIEASNEIVDGAVLDAGQRLWIPGAKATQDVPITFGSDSDLPQSDTPAAHSGVSSDWIWPVVRSRVLSKYGAPRPGNRPHRGLDIGGRNGAPVLAARDGKVIYSSDGMRGYGKTVILDHGDGYRSLYAHNSKLLVNFGQAVLAGQPIARVGRTGNASGDHLHFEIRKSNRPVDPLPYLNLARKGQR